MSRALPNGALAIKRIFTKIIMQERSPPSIDDFCYICEDAYGPEEVIEMEEKILKALNFDIGIPLSYRFLRRYARVSNSP